MSLLRRVHLVRRRAGLAPTPPGRQGATPWMRAIAAFAMTVAFVAVAPPVAQAAPQAANPAGSAAAADTTAPTVPGGFTYSINCALVLTLHWTASTDDVGFTGYDVYRSIGSDPFTLVRTVPTTSFTESLAGFVRYQVRARDAAGNVSAFTASVNIVPPPCRAPTDTTPPTTPGPVSWSINCALVVVLNWGASTDNVGVIGYDVYRSTNNGPFTSVATTPTTTFTETLIGLVRYEVRARDAVGNVSAFTAPVNVVPPPCLPPDTQPPTTPGPVGYSISCALVVVFNWGASTDNVGVVGYDVYRSTNSGPFTLIATTTTTSFTETFSGIVRYEMQARDAAGNVSAFTAPVTIVPPPCPPPDIQPPTTPGTPTASGTTGSSTTLTWAASTDNMHLTGYDIYRAPGATGGTFAPVGTSATSTFTDTGLAAGATYRYQVRARDAAGNVSPFSAAVTVTTPAAGCSATLVAQAGWYNGYVMQPNAVTNTGASAVTGWTVTFTLPAGHTITSSWNAVVTVTGQTVTVHGVAAQNAALAAGATTTWGFQATRPAGNTALPTGATCTTP